MFLSFPVESALFSLYQMLSNLRNQLRSVPCMDGNGIYWVVYFGPLHEPGASWVDLGQHVNAGPKNKHNIAQPETCSNWRMRNLWNLEAPHPGGRHESCKSHITYCYIHIFIHIVQSSLLTLCAQITYLCEYLM